MECVFVYGFFCFCLHRTVKVAGWDCLNGCGNSMREEGCCVLYLVIVEPEVEETWTLSDTFLTLSMV